MADADTAGPPPEVAPPRPGFFASLRGAPATLVFLSACVVLFAVAELHGSTNETRTLVRFGALERSHLWAGEPWRLLSAGFLHIGFAHLAWNLVGLFGWCVPLERAMGSARFSAVYLGSLVAASAASVLLHDVVSAGASGAGFGVVGATLALGRRRLGSWRAFAANPFVRRVAFTAVLWTAVLAGMNVDHAAHGGGFVAGAALAWALSAPPSAPARARRLAWLAAAVLVAVPVSLALVPRAGLSRYATASLAAEIEEAVQRGDLDGAARKLDELARSSDPRIREEAAAAARALREERARRGGAE